MNSFDIDGVIFISKEVGGLHPGPNDVLITGRSFEERAETEAMLNARGIHNKVFFNPLPFAQKTRKSSGVHKGNTLNWLKSQGCNIGVHFEDDDVQAYEIRMICPLVPVVMIVHDLTEKENVRHTFP